MSTFPSILENILTSKDKHVTHHDYLIALSMIIMKENGYDIQKAHNRGDFAELDPSQWIIDGAYQIKFKHLNTPELNCILDAILVGDVMILNLTSEDESIKTRSLAVETLEYINVYASNFDCRFMNLKKFTCKFRNLLTTPIRDEVLNKLGVMNPSLLGLPNELKLKIISFLPAKDQRNLRRCCKTFYNL
ncbi:LOW QUALITY PROTEIN: uncharacterized protein ntc [Chelonus insularis]|uniref:LOW QUALITY PROTEIN: uncharacterized protein ntc n=1 Tax=Chelonus insularis TaxID=460826 RepID=UPI0033B69452